MARIRDFAGTVFPAATTALTLDMPVHESGDWLFAALNRDSAGGTFTAPAGWMLIRQNNSAGSSNAMFALYAASSSETAAFTHTSETGTGVVVAVRDGEAQKTSGTITLGCNAGTGVWTRSAGDFSADGFVAGMTVFVTGMTTAANNGARVLTAVGTTTFTTATTGMVTEGGSGNELVVSVGIGQHAGSGADDSTNPIAGSGITPLFTNSLLIHFLGGDAMLAPLVLPPWINLFGGDAAQGGICVSYSVEPTTSAVTAPNHWAGVADDARGIIIEVMAGDNDTQAPYIPLDTVPAVQISAMVGTDSPDAGAHVAAAGIAITTVAGKTVTGVTQAAVTDSGVNVFRSVSGVAGVSSTTNLSHSEFNLTATFDATVDAGIIFGTYFHLTPRDWFDQGTPLQGGKYVLFGSSTTAWRAWVVGGYKAKDDRPDGRTNYAIQVGNTDTQYDAAGTADYSVLDYIARGSSGFRGAPAIRWSSMFSLRTCVLAGGTAANPFNFDDLVYVVNNGCGVIPIMEKSGQAAVVWMRLQFGGNETIGIRCNLNTFQMPERADEVSLCTFHVAPDHIGYEFYGLTSADLLDFANSVFTSPSSYYWRFHASHDADAVLDFSGTTVVNATVTLRSTVTLVGTTFISCGTFTQNAAVLNGCSFNGTTATATDPEGFVGCDFTWQPGATAHTMTPAIACATTGTYTMSGNLFSGYGPTKRTFHTTNSVNATTDVVTTDAPHGYTTGDPILYYKMGGSVNMGLGAVSDDHFVRAISTTELAFYDTEADALADTSRIALTSTGSETHHLYSPSAAYFNDTTGTQTLNIEDGGDLPSFRNRNSSTSITVVNLAASYTLTGLVAGSDVRIFDEATNVELAGIDSSGTSFAYDYNYVADVDVRIVIQQVGYLWKELDDTLTSTSRSQAVVQDQDFTYVP